MEKATVNEFGDLVCAYCGTAHITPPGFDVIPSTSEKPMTCQLCKKFLEVDQRTADLANKRTITSEDVEQVVNSLLERESK